MPFSDDWARDPHVRAMRPIFAAMETAQKSFLKNAGIDPWMQNLSFIRAQARNFFEKAWPQALQAGKAREPKEASGLYILCLAHALLKAGIDPAAPLPPEAEAMQDFMQKVLK